MNGNLVNKRSTPLLHPKLSFLHRPQKKHGLSHSLCRALQQQPAPSPPTPLDHQEVWDMPCQGHIHLRHAIQPTWPAVRVVTKQASKPGLPRARPLRSRCSGATPFELFGSRRSRGGCCWRPINCAFVFVDFGIYLNNDVQHCPFIPFMLVDHLHLQYDCDI